MAPSRRVLEFPVPYERCVCEPFRVEWITAGWLTLQDGRVIDSHGRKELMVRCDGRWTFRVKEAGAPLWREFSGDAQTPLLDYLHAALDVQFVARPRATG